MSRMPVLFLGHGSPMNAIEDNAWSRGWREAGKRLPRPNAILMISAHWETRGLAVTAAERPETIHDFGGFPQALFDVQYPAPGDPALAKRVADLLGEPVHQHLTRGFDHGAWSVIGPMYPDADIPMVQLSLDRTKSAQEHYELGKKLRPLRDEGVLIVGSGDIVHNLRAVDWRNPDSRVEWADRFNDTAKRLIEQGDHQPLIDYAELGEDAAQSINSAEHYLPLLYVLGAQEPGERVSFFNDDVFAAISMTSLALGAEELAA